MQMIKSKVLSSIKIPEFWDNLICTLSYEIFLMISQHCLHDVLVLNKQQAIIFII